MVTKKSRAFKTSVVAGVVAAIMVVGTALAFAVAPPQPNATATDTKVGNEVRVDWAKDALAASWKVEYKKVSAPDTAWVSSDVATNTITVSGLENGTAYTFRVAAVSLTGEGSGWGTAVEATPSDQTAPVTVFSPFPKEADGANGWYVSWPSYQFVVNEIANKSEYSVNGGPATELTNKTDSFGSATYALAEGVNRVEFSSTDRYGNVEDAKVATVTIDVTKPTLESVVMPIDPDGNDGWYTSAPTINLSAVDAISGVASLSYAWNSGSAATTDAASIDAAGMPEGKNVLSFKAADEAGLVSDEATMAIKLDSVAPSVPAGLAARAVAGGDIEVSWAASTDADSGLAGYTIAYSGAATASVEATAGQTSVIVPSSSDGTVTITAAAFDVAGNVSKPSAGVACVSDKTAPVAVVAPAGVAPWSTKSAEATISATDVGLGVSRMAWSITRPGGAEVASGTVMGGADTLIAIPEGVCVLEVTAFDNAGNTHFIGAPFFTDWTAPSSALSASPAEPNGDNGWYRSIDATIAAQDAPGFGSAVETLTVNGVEYGGSDYTVTPKQGVNEFEFFAVDKAGNKETTKTASFKFDSVAPVLDVDFGSYVAGTPTSADVTASVNATDAVSGVDRIEVQTVAYGAETTSTGWAVVESEFTVPGGDLDVYFRAIDKAGNVFTAEPMHVIVDKQAPITSVTTNPEADGANGSWLTKPVITLKTLDVDGYTIDWSLVRPTEATMTGSASKPDDAILDPADYYSTPGTYTLEFRAIDGAGNAEATQTASFVIDPGQPVIDFSMVVPDGNADWYTVDPTATVSAAASDDATIAAVFYSINDGEFTKVESCTVDFKAAVEGAVKLKAYAEDVNGRRGPTGVYQYKVDTVAPTFSGLKATAFNTRKPEMGILAEDKTSGLVPAEDMEWSDLWIESYWAAGTKLVDAADGYTLLSDTDITAGEHKIVGTLYDQAGNETRIDGAYFKIDLTAPVVSITEGDAFDANAVLKIQAIDALTGVAKVGYKVDGGAEVMVDGDVADLIVSDAGTHKVEYWAVDVAGNVCAVAEKTFTVNSKTSLTLTMPTLVAYGQKAAVKATLKDANGKLVAGKTVVLFRSTDSATWTQVSSAVSGADGVADLGLRSVVPGKRNYFKAEFAESGSYSAASAAKSLQMRASLGAPSIATQVAKNKYYTVKGAQKSLAKSTALRVYVYKYNTKTKKYDYVRYYSAKATSTTAFSGSVKFSSAGKYRIRTYYAGSTNGAASAWSVYRYTTVK